jgi:hypothetical protein
LIGIVRISQEDQGKLMALSEKERQRLLDKLVVELSRQKVFVTIYFPQQIRIMARVSLSRLAQDLFLNKVDDVDSVMNLAVFKLRLLLES